MEIDSGNTVIETIVASFSNPSIQLDEIRNLLLTEAQCLLICKICHKNFTHVPEFVHHKRHDCRLAYLATRTEEDDALVGVLPDNPEEPTTSKRIPLHLLATKNRANFKRRLLRRREVITFGKDDDNPKVHFYSLPAITRALPQTIFENGVQRIVRPAERYLPELGKERSERVLVVNPTPVEDRMYQNMNLRPKTSHNQTASNSANFAPLFLSLSLSPHELQIVERLQGSNMWVHCSLGSLQCSDQNCRCSSDQSPILFSSVEILAYHFCHTKAHGPSLAPYDCLLCGKHFTKQLGVANHVMQVHKSAHRQYNQEINIIVLQTGSMDTIIPTRSRAASPSGVKISSASGTPVKQSSKSKPNSPRKFRSLQLKRPSLVRIMDRSTEAECSTSRNHRTEACVPNITGNMLLLTKMCQARAYKCNFCLKYYSNPVHVKQHMEHCLGIVELSQRKEFNCPSVADLARQKTNLGFAGYEAAPRKIADYPFKFNLRMVSAGEAYHLVFRPEPKIDSVTEKDEPCISPRSIKKPESLPNAAKAWRELCIEIKKLNPNIANMTSFSEIAKHGGTHFIPPPSPRKSGGRKSAHPVKRILPTSQLKAAKKKSAKLNQASAHKLLNRAIIRSSRSQRLKGGVDKTEPSVDHISQRGRGRPKKYLGKRNSKTNVAQKSSSSLELAIELKAQREGLAISPSKSAAVRASPAKMKASKMDEELSECSSQSRSSQASRNTDNSSDAFEYTAIRLRDRTPKTKPENMLPSPTKHLMQQLPSRGKRGRGRPRKSDKIVSYSESKRRRVERPKGKRVGETVTHNADVMPSLVQYASHTIEYSMEEPPKIEPEDPELESEVDIETVSNHEEEAMPFEPMGDDATSVGDDASISGLNSQPVDVEEVVPVIPEAVTEWINVDPDSSFDFECSVAVEPTPAVVVETRRSTLSQQDKKDSSDSSDDDDGFKTLAASFKPNTWARRRSNVPSILQRRKPRIMDPVRDSSFAFQLNRVGQPPVVRAEPVMSSAKLPNGGTTKLISRYRSSRPIYSSVNLPPFKVAAPSPKMPYGAAVEKGGEKRDIRDGDNVTHMSLADSIRSVVDGKSHGAVRYKDIPLVDLDSPPSIVPQPTVALVTVTPASIALMKKSARPASVGLIGVRSTPSPTPTSRPATPASDGGNLNEMSLVELGLQRIRFS